MKLTKPRRKEIIERFKIHETDTGSPAVQIALLSERINYLAEHLKIHRKDFHSREGLLKLVGQRRHLLNYLKGYAPETYKKILEELDLRR